MENILNIREQILTARAIHPTQPEKTEMMAKLVSSKLGGSACTDFYEIVASIAASMEGTASNCECDFQSPYEDAELALWFAETDYFSATGWWP